MTTAKEHGINISLSTVGTLIPVLAIIWLIVKPALLVSISEAVADDMQTMIVAQTAPLQGAFKTIIKSDIEKLKRAISRLEYKERHNPSQWTPEDADALTDLKIELQDLQGAYASL